MSRQFKFRNPDAPVTIKQAYLLARYRGVTGMHSKQPELEAGDTAKAIVAHSGITVAEASDMIDQHKADGNVMMFYRPEWTNKPDPKLVKKAAPKTSKKDIERKAKAKSFWSA